ncbi:MAG: TRAP transporter small permease [Mailhella sp.]|nr:TRAP transporter small permease [Mailhella sp.]
MSFLSRFYQFSNVMDKVAQGIIVAAITVMTLTTTLQVCLRYLANAALTWPEEVNLLLMPWVAFVGASVAIRRAEHIGITLFIDKLPPVLRKSAYLIGYIIVAVILVLLLKASWKVAMLNMNVYSDAMRIPLIYSRISMVVGSVFMLIQLVYVILKTTTKEGASS